MKANDTPNPPILYTRGYGEDRKMGPIIEYRTIVPTPILRKILQGLTFVGLVEFLSHFGPYRQKTNRRNAQVTITIGTRYFNSKAGTLDNIRIPATKAAIQMRKFFIIQNSLSYCSSIGSEEYRIMQASIRVLSNSCCTDKSSKKPNKPNKRPVEPE